MFWSGNYIVVKQLNSLLKEEGVGLWEVLEAEDLLQECQADNKALKRFLTRADILAELITLVTEEPPKDLEPSMQYWHSYIACEVLTSQLSTLSDCLSADVVQMTRLCDFINKEPPLNPLLASFFSKTIRMLLDRGNKQDFYLYHIVCLRVLELFKSRRDFLPNLLRHLATSSIADVLKHLIRLTSTQATFKKLILEWLEDYQFLECLIQIICGTYEPEELPSLNNHRADTVDTDDAHQNHAENNGGQSEALRAVAADNAASLLGDIVLEAGPAGSGTHSPHGVWELAERVRSPQVVSALLQGVFTSPSHFRRHALVHGLGLLRKLLAPEPAPPDDGGNGGEQDGQPAPAESEQCDRSTTSMTSVELAVAPHLPLLHQALLQEPTPLPHRTGPLVGAARLRVTQVVGALCSSPLPQVANTLVTLGTLGVMLELMFRHVHNTFLQGAVVEAVGAALLNTQHKDLYLRHLVGECGLMERVVGALEVGGRGGARGHVVLLARLLQQAGARDLLGELEPLCPPQGDLGPLAPKGDLLLLKEDLVPSKENLVPSKENLVPSKEDLVPSKEDLVPSKEDLVPSKGDLVPSKGDLVPLALQGDLEPLAPQGDLGDPESQVSQEGEVGPQGLAQRWDTLCRDTLQPLYELHLGYLGGYYPSETDYEYNNTLETVTTNFPADTQDTADYLMKQEMFLSKEQQVHTYDSKWGDDDEQPTGEGVMDGEEVGTAAENGEGQEAADPGDLALVLDGDSPWDSSAPDDGNRSGEGWANFGGDFESVGGAGPTPGTGTDNSTETAGWDASTALDELSITSDLANNLLTAMCGMAPEMVASIVGAADETPESPRESPREPPREPPHS